MEQSFDDLDSFFDNSEIRFKTQSPQKIKDGSNDDFCAKLYVVLFGSVVAAKQLVGGYVKIESGVILEGKLFLDVCSMVECFFYTDDDPSNHDIGSKAVQKEVQSANLDKFTLKLEKRRNSNYDMNGKESQLVLPTLNLKEGQSKNHRVILYDESIEIFEFDQKRIEDAIMILPFKLDVCSMLNTSKSCILKLDKSKRMRVKLYHTLTCRLESKFKPKVTSYSVPLTILEHKPADHGVQVSKFVDGMYRCSMTLSHTVVHPKSANIEIMVAYDKSMPYQYANFILECKITGKQVQDLSLEIIKETVLLSTVAKKTTVNLDVESGSCSPKVLPLVTTHYSMDLRECLPAMESIVTESLQVAFFLTLELSKIGHDSKVDRVASHSLVLTRTPSRQYHISTDKRSLLYEKLLTVDEPRLMLPFTTVCLSTN